MGEPPIDAGVAESLAETAAAVEAILDAELPRPAGAQARLFEAMRYGVLGGGKRLRAFLVHSGARLAGADDGAALLVAAAVEMVHGYSLIHDDLPAMDDDDLRRGRPSCHVAFDEATAILAGDALLTLAFELLADPRTHPDPSVRCSLVRAMAKAAGGEGMVGGQMIDLASEQHGGADYALTVELERMKTGALIAYSCEAGAILARRDGELRRSLREFGRDVGLAFQVIDDVLDVVEVVAVDRPHVVEAQLPEQGAAGHQAARILLGPLDPVLDHLLPILRNVRDDAAAGPILVHVRTRKGKGYAPAEESADRYHGVSSFDVDTGAQKASASNAPPSFTRVFAESLVTEARLDDRICAITAAMPSGTGVDLFERVFPDRAFDVGLAEQHAVTFAAGLAADGMKPFVAICSTFLQRAYDQIVHDVAIQGLPVRFAMDRAGLVGADGQTHAGAYDIACLGCLPGMVLMAAADECELVHMVRTAVAIDDRPCAFRYPRGAGFGAALPERGEVLEIGEGRIMREGTRAAILSYGARLHEALSAAEELAGRGVSTTVADARFAKPLDGALVRALAREHEVLITIEEGAVGGFGAQVLHFLAGEGILDGGGPKVRPMVLPDRFLDHDKPDLQYEAAGLRSTHIRDTALAALGRRAETTG